MGTRPAKRLPRFACAEFFAGSEPHPCHSHRFSLLPKNKPFIRSDMDASRIVRPCTILLRVLFAQNSPIHSFCRPPVGQFEYCGTDAAKARCLASLAKINSCWKRNRTFRFHTRTANKKLFFVHSNNAVYPAMDGGNAVSNRCFASAKLVLKTVHGWRKSAAGALCRHTLDFPRGKGIMKE